MIESHGKMCIRDRNMGKGVLGYWLFVMSWIPINIVALCNPNLEWKAIPHTRSLRMDQMKDTGCLLYTSRCV